jgi:hypothetical protein
MFSIDGMQWDVPCQIVRTAEVTASEISGLLLDKSYFNDVLGTWMRYEVSVPVPFGRENDYAALYELLTEPVDGHVFVLPYNNETITVTGRVEMVDDNWFPKAGGGGSYWAGCKFVLIGNAPSKTMSLGAVIARGRTALPDVQNPEVGDAYTWNGSVWVETTYTDADDTYY